MTKCQLLNLRPGFSRLGCEGVVGGPCEDTLMCWNVCCAVFFQTPLDWPPSPSLHPVLICGVNFEITLLSFKLTVCKPAQVVQCWLGAPKVSLEHFPLYNHSETNNQVKIWLKYLPICGLFHLKEHSLTFQYIFCQ